MTWCWDAGWENHTLDSTLKRFITCSSTWPRHHQCIWTYWDKKARATCMKASGFLKLPPPLSHPKSLSSKALTSPCPPPCQLHLFLILNGNGVSSMYNDHELCISEQKWIEWKEPHWSDYSLVTKNHISNHSQHLEQVHTCEFQFGKNAFGTWGTASLLTTKRKQQLHKQWPKTNKQRFSPSNGFGPVGSHLFHSKSDTKHRTWN